MTYCPWPQPGLNPYTGDKPSAVRRLTDIPQAAREELCDLIRDRAWSAQLRVTRDSLDEAGRYHSLRNMNWGEEGRICPGPVDRSMWPADRVERALLYQAGPWCVCVFSACGNVAMLSDKQRPVPVMRRLVGSVNSVPEPGSLALVGMAALAWVISRRSGK